MIRFICAQPSELYFAWQVEVMLNNFIEMGVNLEYVDIVCTKENNKIPEIWKKLSNGYNARFFFYDDTRITKNYISSIRPNILKQHFKKYPELKDETIFYHDCDIIFTKPISEWIISDMLDDELWYGSDTASYIGYEYILTKGDDVLDLMCNITGIDKNIIKINEKNTIGAQYIIKNVSFDFWERVECDSESLYLEIVQLNNKKKKQNPQYHELQIWCSDMWALLWNAWKFGYVTRTHDNLQFSWAKSNLYNYNRFNIMHNSGLENKDVEFFQKWKHIKSLPYNLNLKIKDRTASKQYYEWIQKTEKKSVLLKNNTL